MADERFPAGHVGIRLHPHGAVRDPLAALHRLLDSGEKLGIVLLAHLIGGRLALDELVLRILLNQAKLGREGPLGLAVGLRHGPEPCQIQMGVAHGVEDGSAGAVLRLHHRAQGLPGRLIGSDASLPGLLEIRDQRELLQCLGNLRSPQGGLVQSRQQGAEGGHIHVQLIRVLVPDAVGAFPQDAPLPFLRRILKCAGQHGSCGAASRRGLWHEMSRIGLHQDVIMLPALGTEAEHIVLHEVMWLVHPGGPVSPEGFPVHEQRGLPLGLQIHHNPLALRLLRQGDAPLEPAVLPLMPPGKARAHRLEGPFQRLLRCQIFHGGEGLPGNLPQRLVQVVLQGAHPVLHPVLPFRMHYFHHVSPLFQKILKKSLLQSFF